MALTSTQVRELAELESRAADLIREKRPAYFASDDTAGWHAARTCEIRATAFMEIAGEMDRHGYNIEAKE